MAEPKERSLRNRSINVNESIVKKSYKLRDQNKILLDEDEQRTMKKEKKF
jgi:hypothetical protein